jgi:hypothetical protein
MAGWDGMGWEERNGVGGDIRGVRMQYLIKGEPDLGWDLCCGGHDSRHSQVGIA